MSRCLGIDFGAKRVGIAISDSSNLIASPLKTLTFKNHDHLLQQLKIIILEKNIRIIILGLPLNMTGEDSPQTQKIREFKSALSIFNLPVKYEDERLSSLIAKKSMILQKIKTFRHLFQQVSAYMQFLMICQSSYHTQNPLYLKQV